MTSTPTLHVWTADTARYPLAAGYRKEEMKPASFTPEELFKHTKPVGVTRISLIQMSYYGFDNSYMCDVIAKHKGVFVGTAVIDPYGRDPAAMTALAAKGVRASASCRNSVRSRLPVGFNRPASRRCSPRRPKTVRRSPVSSIPTPSPNWIACVANTPRRRSSSITSAASAPTAPSPSKDVRALCDLAKHRRVMVKVGAFYALGKKKAPYTDLAGLIGRVVAAYGASRCMWESDCPFQVEGGHTYKDSIELIKSRLIVALGRGSRVAAAEDGREVLLRREACHVAYRTHRHPSVRRWGEPGDESTSLADAVALQADEADAWLGADSEPLSAQVPTPSCFSGPATSVASVGSPFAGPTRSLTRRLGFHVVDRLSPRR